MKQSTGTDEYLSRSETLHRQDGFSLIELMMVLVIVGILTSIAYPSYQDYVARARRTDGKTLLMDVAARQERYFADHNSYSTDVTDLGYTAANSKEGFYTATVAAGAMDGSGDITTAYTITAAPVAAAWGGSGDTKCGDLILDSRGGQGTSAGTNDVCWR